MKQSILILPFLLAACSILGDDADVKITTDDIVFETDQSAYTSYLDPDEEWITYRFTLVARFENRSNRTIYLSSCKPDSPNPIYGLKLLDENQSKRSAYGWIYACSGHNQPLSVPARSIRVDTLHVRGPMSWQHGTHQPTGIFEGSFRLLYQAQTCRETDGEGCHLPDSLSQSNEFEVRLSE